MRDCPTCKLPLANDAVCCNSCGWSTTATKHTERALDWWQCCHEDRGLRCANPGSVSPSTSGTGKGKKHASGPWFCWQHVPAMQQMRDGVRCLPPMGFAALRALVARPIKPYDFEAEAERIALQSDK